MRKKLQTVKGLILAAGHENLARFCSVAGIRPHVATLANRGWMPRLGDRILMANELGIEPSELVLAIQTSAIEALRLDRARQDIR